MNDTNYGILRTYLIYLLSLLTIIVLTATVSFYHFEVGVNSAIHSYWDSLWWTFVTISTIGYGDIYPQTIGGRIVAIVLVFTGIGTLGVSTAAISAYFIRNDQLQRFRVRGLSGHVVICGLGDKGVLLARSFALWKRPVIVLEKDEGNENIEVCSSLGAIVFVGDASEREMLMQVRASSAQYLIAVCGDDGVNAEIAAHMRELVRGNGGRSGAAHLPQRRRATHPLVCIVHIVAPELWRLLRRWELASDGALRMQFFNVFDIGARALLAAHPPFAALPKAHEGAPKTPLSPTRVVIIGGGEMGRSVAVHVARQWHVSPPPSGESENKSDDSRFCLTFVDKEVAHLEEELLGRNPGMARTCHICVEEINVRSADFGRGKFLHDAEGRYDTAIVYICLGDDTLGLTSALALQHHTRRNGTPVVVAMRRDAGLARLVRDVEESAGGAHLSPKAAVHSLGHGSESLSAFGLLENACRPELVLGGVNERLARALHESYVRDQQERTVSGGPANASLVPWEQLPEDLRESNRSQAGHIGQKLFAVGCDIAPLSGYEPPQVHFAPSEIDKMAKMEHERWVGERKAQGWTYGPQRDNAKKTNPSLLPWDKIPEESRQQNRESVELLPGLLAQAGFEIYRLSGSAA